MSSAPAIRSEVERDDYLGVSEAIAGGLDPRSVLSIEPPEDLLALAISAGSAKVADVLLQAGADWAADTAYREDAESPLALALRIGTAEVVGAFCGRGVVAQYPPSWLEDCAEEALSRAADGGNLLFFEAIVARVEQESPLSGSTLRRAAEYARRAARRKGEGGERWSTVAARLVASAKREAARVDAIIDEMRNPVRTRAVLEQIADLSGDARGRAASQALVLAVFNSQWSAVEELLRLGADVRATDRDGQSALMWAASRGNLELVRRLVQLGAEVATRDTTNSRYSALDFARVARRDAVVSYLQAVLAGHCSEDPND